MINLTPLMISIGVALSSTIIEHFLSVSGNEKQAKQIGIIATLSQWFIVLFMVIKVFNLVGDTFIFI